MHFVDYLRLVCVFEHKFDSRYNRYDLVVKPVRVFDGLSRSLVDFI